MSANINHVTGVTAVLDRLPETPTPLTEKDVQEPSTLVRLLTSLMRDVRRVLGLWRPRRIDFVDVESTGSAGLPETIRLTHGLGGPVRWWLVDVQPTTGLIAIPYISRDDASTDNVLALTFYYPSKFAIRVEEAG